MTGDIVIKGIETNNLKKIDVVIKKHVINLIIGPSGSGKSSLAYDTIAQIGLHEYMSMFSDDIVETTYKVTEYNNMTATVPIRQNNYNSNIRSTIGTYFGLNSKLAIVYASMLDMPESFFLLNREENACEYCHGVGYVEELDVTKIIDYNKPLNKNPFKCWQRYGDFYSKIIERYCEEKGIDASKTFDQLSASERNIILFGESEKKYQIIYKHGKGRSSRTTKFFGIMTNVPMRKNFEPAKRFYSHVICTHCKGMKFSKEHLKHKICNISIGELMLVPFSKLEPILKKMENQAKYKDIRVLLRTCITFVEKANQLNLNHLFLNRSIPTLSGGELQRLRLVQVFNSQLSDLVVVLDEPLAGLSGVEKRKIYENIINLSSKHTVIVVDHSDLFVKVAENIIALGVGGGQAGGRLIDVNKYLAEQRKIPLIEKLPIDDIIHVKMNTNIHNYSGVDVSFAINRINVVSGPSGIGKTTLIGEYLPRFFDSYVYINQKQIVGNQNSNVATLLGISIYIYKYFADIFDKNKNFFSNMSGKEGACPACDGAGYKDYGNHRLRCGKCNGYGFNTRLINYKIDRMSIFDIWNMTIDQGAAYFETIDKKIVKILSAAKKLALGHLKIGQATTSLSGGENIRIKLLKLENSTADVVGIDEPFKGLNPTEINEIMKYLVEIRNQGKTVIVVDHTDIVKQCFDKHIIIETNNGEIREKK